MHEVNKNLPGSRVIKKDGLLLSNKVVDYLLINQLPKFIWPNILQTLYFDGDIDLNDQSDSNVLDTDINILIDSGLICDLQIIGFPEVILLAMKDDVFFKSSDGFYIRLKPS